jgi:hypothetical protein
MTSETELSAQAASRLAKLIARGEIAEEGLYAGGATGWHNTDEVWAPMTEAPGRMAAIRRVVPDFHAEEIEMYAWAGGFVIQYAFVGTAPGDRIRIVGCLVGTVVGKEIVRLREYVDSAHTVLLTRILAVTA